MNKRVAAIIVTHDSAKVLPRCVQKLLMQSIPVSRIVIVDCGSDNVDYLVDLTENAALAVIYEKNIGFSRANNRGLEFLQSDFDVVLFINPDLFLPENFVEKMLVGFEQGDNRSVFSGKLLGYDVDENKPTGLLDSTGIFRKWYGRWYDRGQGEEDTGKYQNREVVPALCGALLCMPAELVTRLENRVFNEDFFLYKEDIELGLRLKKLGYTSYYDPNLVAYHCRGWDPRRRNMSYSMRLLAARSELKLYKFYPSIYVIFAMMKYLLVRVLKI